MRTKKDKIRCDYCYSKIKELEGITIPDGSSILNHDTGCAIGEDGSHLDLCNENCFAKYLSHELEISVKL